MLLDKVFEILLSPTNRNQFGSILNDLFGQHLADARGGANDQNFLVRERHHGRNVEMMQMRGNKW